MAQENVEVVARLRRGFDTFNRGDFDGAMEGIHPEVEVFLAFDQAPLRGAAAYRAWMEPDAFESQAVEILEIRVSGRKALVHIRTTVRGAGSGIETDVLAWMVFTLDDEGRTTRVEIFRRHEGAEALEAAGLRE